MANPFRWLWNPAILRRHSAERLLLDALGRRREPEVQVARLERILVVAKLRIVGRHRHREARRQAMIEQAGALQLLESGQVAELLQAEMRQEILGRAVGDRPARHLAAAARLDPA